MTSEPGWSTDRPSADASFGSEPRSSEPAAHSPTAPRPGFRARFLAWLVGDGSDEPDSRLVRRVRVRLVAWSAGTTFVVLALLGIVFYTVVANAIQTGSANELQARVDLLTRGRSGVDREPNNSRLLGAAFGGPGSGTYAMVVRASGQVIGPHPAGLPLDASVSAAQAGSSDLRTGDADGVPVRVLSVPVRTLNGTSAVLQVAQVISSERETLGTLVLILTVGGLLALAASGAVGWLYASRALVPIRDFLRRQREFAADASHELRTPLAVLRSNVEFLERHPEASVGSMAEVVTDVRDEVDRMTGLVEDLLLLARTDAGGIELEPVTLDLAKAADEAVMSLGPVAAQRGLRLAQELIPTELVGDPGRLRQLVRILVDNAIKHSPVGGTVSIMVRPRNAHVATLIVEDEGPGIAEADLAHVFERFWRAPGAPSGGSGLGLAIAEWIVRRHRGTIGASNREPHGARFEVQLPTGRS